MSLNNETTVCFQCRGSLVEIDHYGKRLIGCVECNRWTRLDSEHVTMQLPEEDIEALRYWRAAKKV
jgi:hypothetical protein